MRLALALTLLCVATSPIRAAVIIKVVLDDTGTPVQQAAVIIQTVVERDDIDKMAATDVNGKYSCNVLPGKYSEVLVGIYPNEKELRPVTKKFKVAEGATLIIRIRKHLK